MFYTINHSSSQEGMLAKRHDLQKMAAFNLGVAEAVTHKKKTRDLDFHVRCLVKKKKQPRLSSKSINSSLIEHVKILCLFFFFQKSYIFQKRPLTPPRILKQREYATDLSGQVTVLFQSYLSCLIQKLCSEDF